MSDTPESHCSGADFPEIFTPAEKLVKFLEGRFKVGAYLKYSDYGSGQAGDRGTFFDTVVNGIEGLEVTRNSHRIFMKRPSPDDIPGMFAEIFASTVLVAAEDGAVSRQRTGEFFVRHYTANNPGPLWRVNEAGVVAETGLHIPDVVDPTFTEFSAVDEYSAALEELARLDRADEMLTMLSEYEIFARLKTQ